MGLFASARSMLCAVCIILEKRNNNSGSGKSQKGWGHGAGGTQFHYSEAENFLCHVCLLLPLRTTIAPSHRSGITPCALHCVPAPLFRELQNVALVPDSSTTHNSLFFLCCLSHDITGVGGGFFLLLARLLAFFRSQKFLASSLPLLYAFYISRLFRTARR